MNLADFSNKEFEQAKQYIPFWPNGQDMDAKIYLRSMKSTHVLKVLDSIEKRKNQGAKGIDQAINADIDMCCAMVDAIEGFTIEPEDNEFNFDLDGNKIISNSRNIRLLMENFLFLRKQVATKANDDGFFYDV